MMENLRFKKTLTKKFVENIEKIIYTEWKVGLGKIKEKCYEFWRKT